MILVGFRVQIFQTSFEVPGKPLEVSGRTELLAKKLFRYVFAANAHADRLLLKALGNT